MFKDLTIVIRTNGERTASLCCELVFDQISKENVHLIREKPFFKAVQRTFEIGLEIQTKYLIGLDADILLFPDAIDYMLDEAGGESTDFFRLDFPVYDKFRGRVEGVHFYNNQYSQEFLNHISSDLEAPGYLRKEFDNVKNFSEKNGLVYQRVPHFIAGKHDYFQYSHDIILKYRARRERGLGDKNLQTMIATVRKQAEKNLDDKDYWLALDALEGKLETAEQMENAFKSYAIDEKEVLKERQCLEIRELLSENKILNKLKSAAAGDIYES